MSLLLRRRALEALVRDDWEGGGANDGKYVVCSLVSGSGGTMTLVRMVSQDFGQTFTKAPVASTSTLSRRITGSTEIPFEMTPNGNQWMAAFSRSVACFGYSDLKSTNNLSFAKFTTAPKAVATNKEGTKLLAVYGTNANSVSRITNTGTVETTYATLTNNGIKLADICANGDLTNVIVGQYSESYASSTYRSSTPGLDQGFAPCSGSISYDGGATWTRLQTIVCTDSSASNDDGQLYSAAWSTDGKKCAVVYKDRTYGNSLYLSLDSGHTFRRVTTLPAGFSPFGIQASEKFKTIYVNGYGNSSGSILRSKNKGGSWTQIRSATTRSTVTCNAAGDKLIACTFGTNQQLVYSHDYGNTWANAKSNGSNYTRDYIGGLNQGAIFTPQFASYEAMSRDYSDAPSPTPTGPKVSVSGWNTSTKYGSLDSSQYKFYQSKNAGQSSTTSSMTITALEDLTNFSFYVRSYGEDGYDYATVKNNSGTQIATTKNNPSATNWTLVNVGTLLTGQKVTISYQKDGSVDSGDDMGFVAIANEYLDTGGGGGGTLVYTLTNHDAQGTQATAINTGIKLFNTSDFPNGFRLEFAGKITNASAMPSSQTYMTILGNINETSPYPGLSVKHNQGSNVAPYWEFGANYQSRLTQTFEGATYVGAAISFTASYDRTTCTFKVGSNTYTENSSITHDIPLAVGGAISTDGTSWMSGRFGYIHVDSLKVYKL